MGFIKHVFKNKQKIRGKTSYGIEQNFLKNLLLSAPKIEEKQKLISQKIVVIDTETTGFKVNLGDRVISIGAVMIENGKVNYNNVFNQLVNPQRNIPKNITELTGIDNYMVQDKPLLIEILPHFFTWSGNHLLSGHIVQFDLTFINHSINQHCKIKPNFPYIDTREIVTALFPHLCNCTLEEICASLKIPCKNRHNALSDAIIAARILEFCLVELAKKNVYTLEDLNVYLEKQKLLNSKLLNHVF